MKAGLAQLVNKYIQKPLATAALGILTTFSAFSQDAQGVIKVTADTYNLDGREITFKAQFDDSKTAQGEEFTFELNEQGIANYNVPLPVIVGLDDKDNNANQGEIPSIGTTKVFGNPASATNIYTYTQNEDASQASVFDINGRLISTPKLSTQNGITHAHVDLSSLPKGLYIYKLETSAGSYAMIVAAYEGKADTIFADNLGTFSFEPIELQYDEQNNIIERQRNLLFRGNFKHLDSLIDVNEDLEPLAISVDRPYGNFKVILDRDSARIVSFPTNEEYNFFRASS
jgi:hypothetical protein